jgi:uncharacterized protein with ParB-like and HNH nuclease domain
MALINKSVKELLFDIEKGKLALPDMQREFIWDNTQVRDLANSLYIKSSNWYDPALANKSR